jgi:hypothetical protein
MATDGPEAGSFRDPAGFVFHRDGAVFRQVNRAFADRWTRLHESGLLVDLERRGLLIGHEDVGVDRAFAPATAFAVVRPDQLAFVSYPYEWSFGLLKDAALVTLEAQVIASRAGFTLRDASAFNVQLHRGRPMLIDTLSFEPAEADAPWWGYRQFCEHFLAPLALMAHRDVRCGLLLREFLDGVPVDLAATLLPGRTKLDLGLTSHIHAHARAVRRANDPARTANVRRRGGTGKLRQAALLDSLRRTVEKLRWDPRTTAWADYSESTSYSATAAASKDSLVTQLLESAGGSVVWDLGANTGRFSSIAESLGRNVVAWDGDPGATELHYRSVRAASRTTVIPLLTDLANPSPGLGWENAERKTLIERSNADVVLALALVHHLAIGRNIRLAMIADLLARLAPQVIIEFVPDTDPMAQRLLRTRADLRPGLEIDGFRKVFERRFEIVQDVAIEDSSRRLLLMRRR